MVSVCVCEEGYTSRELEEEEALAKQLNKRRREGFASGAFALAMAICSRETTSDERIRVTHVGGE